MKYTKIAENIKVWKCFVWPMIWTMLILKSCAFTKHKQDTEYITERIKVYTNIEGREKGGL